MRATAAFIALGMLILLGMVGLSYWMLDRTRQSTEEVLVTREMRSSLVDLLSVVQDAETGQRGYLLTGEDRYLTPYDVAVKLTDERFDKLAGVFNRQGGSETFLNELKTDIDAKLAELAKTVDLKKAGRGDDAMAIVLSDTGKDVMDRIRGLIGERREAVEARLNAAVASQRENASILQWSIIGGGILIVLAGAGAAWALTSYTSELVKARAEVESLNSGLELRVRERTADLQRANDEIQRFAYIVSHDLRAPLVNVMGFTTELKTSLEPLQAVANDPIVDGLPVAAEARAAADKDVPEAISFIQASTKKMDSLINAILKLSREGRRNINPEPVNLALLLEGIGASMQHQLNDTGGELVVGKALPTIISDRLALEQVFGNLVDNAVKYQAPGRPPRVEVRARSERDGSVLVEVEDNGRGIADHDHDRVFDLFRRAGAQDKPGEGIGLAHVRALVRRIGGQITLTSELGAGTTFRVKLPRNLRATLEQSGELRG
jgi:signal transduction histidine kinase